MTKERQKIIIKGKNKAIKKNIVLLMLGCEEYLKGELSLDAIILMTKLISEDLMIISQKSTFEVVKDLGLII